MKISTPFNNRIPKDIRANIRWRSAVHKRVINDSSYASAIIDACSCDPLFFINGFAFTHDPRREPFSKLPFILYPYQDDALKDILKAINEYDLLIEKSRDMGASWLNLAAIFWCWRFRKNTTFLLGSRVDDYVDKKGNPKALLWRFDFLLDNLPEWLKPRGYNKNIHRSIGHIENPENGSVVDGEATTENFGAGDRRTAILLDEFARVKPALAYSIVSATGPVSNCRLFNSTPFGSNNAFCDLREINIKRLRLHWSLHPVKSRGLYTTGEDGKLKILISEGYPEDYEPTLDGKIRSPWYDKECKRALSKQEIAQELDIDYLGSSFQYFNSELVNELIRKYARPYIEIGELEYDGTTGDPIGFRQDENGHLRLWCLLNKDNKPSLEHRIVLGVDISAGTGASNSCVVGWDSVTLEKILEYTNPNIRPEELAKQAVAFAKWLNDATLIWESGGPGRQFGSRVMELGYGNIYLRKNDESISGKVSDIPGFASTKETKLVLMGAYRAAIEKGIAINRSKEALEECLEYIFDPQGGVVHARATSKVDPSGAKSNHGDRCIADALAWKLMSDRKEVSIKQELVIPIGSLAWRNKNRENKNKLSNRELSKEWSY